MSADDENPHDDKPLEDEAMDVTGDRSNQTQETAPINDEKNLENEEGQFEAENNEEDISASEVNNVQIENAGEENSAKPVKRSRLKLILPPYLIGLISLSIAALGFCFAPFTEYVHANYKFVPTSNFLWIWICAIIAGAIFLIDLIVVLSLKGAKRIGSLKKLFLARFSLPLAASVIACVIIGLVGGVNYRNYYKAEESYITNDTKVTTPIASPTNIIGKAYNQCYPTGDNYVSGNYQTDAYETSIQNLNTAGSNSLSNTANVLTEFGCVLDALNINKQSGQSTMATLINNALNSQSNDASTHIGPYYVYIFFYYSSNNANETDAWFNIANNNMKGYKYNTSVLPAMSTINSSASFINSYPEAVTALTDIFNSNDVPTSLGTTSQQERSALSNKTSSNSLSSSPENSSNDENSNSGGTTLSTPTITSGANSNNNNANSNLSNSDGNNSGSNLMSQKALNAMSNPSSAPSMPTTSNLSNSSASSPNSKPSSNSDGNNDLNSGSSDSSVQNNQSSKLIIPDTVTDFNNAAYACTDIYSFYNSMYQDAGGGIVATGGGKWGVVMNCIAKNLQMPSNVEEKLKSYLNSSNPHYQNLSMNWTLHDGSKIYLTYVGPLVSGTIGWSAVFS